MKLHGCPEDRFPGILGEAMPSSCLLQVDDDDFYKFHNIVFII